MKERGTIEKRGKLPRFGERKRGTREENQREKRERRSKDVNSSV